MPRATTLLGTREDSPRDRLAAIRGDRLMRGRRADRVDAKVPGPREERLESRLGVPEKHAGADAANFQPKRSSVSRPSMTPGRSSASAISGERSPRPCNTSHREWTHQGVGTRLIEGVAERESGRIVRRTRLSGYLHHEYRDASRTLDRALEHDVHAVGRGTGVRRRTVDLLSNRSLTDISESDILPTWPHDLLPP